MISESDEDGDVFAASNLEPTRLFYIVRPLDGDPIPCTWCLCSESDLDAHHDCSGPCEESAVRTVRVIWAGEEFPGPIFVCAEHLTSLRRYLDSLPNRDS